jgi:hypothetical protein
MKTKDRKAIPAGHKSLRHETAEKQAVKKFNAELQKAIDAIDWSRVKLPRQSC